MGALVLTVDAAPRPVLRGGGQERGWRAGTENLPGIVGFGRAAALARADLDRAPEIALLRERIERRILEAASDAPIHGRAAPRLPNTSCIGMPGVESEVQVMAFDLAGIAVSAGSACSSGKLRRSHVLEAMGASPAEAGSAIRVSLGPTTTREEVDRFCETWAGLHARLAAGATAQPFDRKKANA